MLVLHLKRFKVDLQAQVMRKVRDRVIWERNIDVSPVCVDDARAPEPLPEPEREVAHQEALDASTDPLNVSQDGGGEADADMDDELRRVLELSKKEHADRMKQSRAKEREEEELKLAVLASVRDHSTCCTLLPPILVC